MLMTTALTKSEAQQMASAQPQILTQTSMDWHFYSSPQAQAHPPPRPPLQDLSAQE